MSWRRATLLAADLLNATLAVQRSKPLVLKTPFERRVADGPESQAHDLVCRAKQRVSTEIAQNMAMTAEPPPKIYAVTFRAEEHGQLRTWAGRADIHPFAHLFPTRAPFPSPAMPRG